MPMEISPKSGQEPEDGVSSGALASDLRAVIRRTARRMRTEAPVTQVTPSQYSVLSALKHGPSTVSALAEREHVSSPAITRLVVALGARALVDRVSDPSDRRQVLVSLSAQGREMLDASRVRRTEWLEERLAALDAADLRTLAAAVEILARISTK
jgi:DNA-binding MarR family transcriptional regulator